MNMYTYLITDNFAMVINTTTAESVKFFSNDIRYEDFIELIEQERFEETFELSTKNIVKNFFNQTDAKSEVEITIEDDVGYITFIKSQDKRELSSALTKRILKMNAQGYDCQPLIEFIKKLYSNPIKTAIDELFLFMEVNELPITEDGDLIAYKIIMNNYKDIFSQTIDNSPGQIVIMKREDVDSDRDRTCSHGLHFCSKDYLRWYGSSQRNDDKCVLVKINPADVVSIPSDYNNAKGRACRYVVLGEMTEGWRDILGEIDFTCRSIVTNKHLEQITKKVVVATANETIDDDEEYKSGYLLGWDDAKSKVPPNSEMNPNNDNISQEKIKGYKQGYKDKKGHKSKKFK